MAGLVDRILQRLKFLRDIHRNRRTIRRLLESGNLAFVRFAIPGHFYSPIPDLNEIALKAAHVFDRSMRDLPGIEINEASQIHLARSFSVLCREMPFPDAKSEGWRYYLDNPYYSYGDGIVLYAFMRHFRPRRVIEVGSGFSSCAMLDINDSFLGGQVEFTFIEPFPKRLFGLLSEADRQNLRIETTPVQELEPDIFGSLEAGDILFIDSSHVAKISSDVLHILFQVLPRLKKGVIVHFHDVLWPFEYPQEWLEGGRAWNEAYFLRSFLQYNAAFEILYFNSYMALHHAGLVEQCMPHVLKEPSQKGVPGNTSLWLRKAV